MLWLMNLWKKIFDSIATKSTALQLLKLAFMVAGFLVSSWVYYDQYIKPEYHSAMLLYESYSVANNLAIDNPSSANCQPQQIKYGDCVASKRIYKLNAAITKLFTAMFDLFFYLMIALFVFASVLWLFSFAIKRDTP